MEELYEWLDSIQDYRQPAKVRHKLKDIIVIVLFATLENSDNWEEIEDFAIYYEDYLRQYIELPNGIPSHDTIQRVMAMVNPEQLQQLQVRWQELLNRDEGEKIKWKGLKTVIMERKTIKRENGELQEYRYFISSLSPDITLASRAVRGHWAVESMHWHLDVTFNTIS